MAEIAFDTLQYARRLKAAGVSEQQAEVQAELMAEALGYYIGDLVTRDYLDATLDARFNQQDAKIERRFQDQSEVLHRIIAEIAVLRTEMNGKFKLNGWMLALLSAAVLGPFALKVGQVFLEWAYF